MAVALMVSGLLTLCLRRPDLGSNRIARELAVDHAPDAEGIFVFQLRGQGGLGKILKTDWADETVDCLRADGSCAAVAGGGIRATVDHGVADLDESLARGMSRRDDRRVVGGDEFVEELGEITVEENIAAAKFDQIEAAPPLSDST